MFIKWNRIDACIRTFVAKQRFFKKKKKPSICRLYSIKIKNFGLSSPIANYLTKK